MTLLQFAASNPTKSVWVSASAGTGKTKLLVDRLLRLLLAGNEPGKILCLTFTKAAAAEMESRINQQLSQWAIIDDNELEMRLEKINKAKPDQETLIRARKLFLTLIDSADGLNIQTIHSFCQSLIQKFPIEAGLNPNFQLIDDNEKKILLHKVKDELFANNSSLITNSIDYLSWRLMDGSVNELIDDIAAKSTKFSRMFASYGGSENVIKELFKQFAITDQGDIEDQLLEDFCKIDASTDQALSSFAKILLENGNENEIKRGQIIKGWLESGIEHRKAGFSRYKNIFISEDGEYKKPATKKTILTTFPHLTTVIEQEQIRLIEFLAKYYPLKMANFSKHIINFADQFLKLYSKLKQENSLLDYNDLINITSGIISSPEIGPWVLYKLDHRIEHLLVDEAQDTSKEQWQIVAKLSEEFFAGDATAAAGQRTIFVVGDEKQSIYGFQGADPDIFEEMHNYFKNQSSEEIELLSTSLDLSFRSTPAILDLVDHIFNQPQIKCQFISSENEIKHQSFRDGQFGRVELWPLIKAVNEQEEKFPWQLPLAYQQQQQSDAKLAKIIAAKIKSWLVQKRLLPARGRIITPGDIMVLVRRRNAFTHLLINELKLYDIAVAGIDRIYLLEHIAIQDLLAVANFVLLPIDDYNLACVLKSPVGNISEEELLNLAAKRAGKTLWQTLAEKYDQNESLKNAYLFLQDLLVTNSNLSPFELFSYIINIGGLRTKLWARLGPEVNDVIDEFLDLVAHYEEQHVASLQGFIKWFSVTSLEVKRDQEQSKDQVRVMTVHAAKGLQAPIVIMADTTFNPANNRQDMILWDDYNDLPVVRLANEMEGFCDYSKKIKFSQKQKEFAEHLRLLYVAMTRAEDELIICGYQGKLTLSDNSWYKIIVNSMCQIGKEAMFEIEEEFEQYLLEKNSWFYNTGIANIILSLSDDAGEILQAPIPAFLWQEIIETSEIEYQIASSQLVNNREFTQQFIDQGIVVHKLLQLLVDIDASKREEHAYKLMQKYATAKIKQQQDKIIRHCLELLIKLDNFIPENAKSYKEISLVGMIDGKQILAGQIDRLIVTYNKIMIIDYKTTKNIPENDQEIEPKYVRQLAAYTELLKQVEKDKEINCYIVWLARDGNIAISPINVTSQNISNTKKTNSQNQQLSFF